MMLVSLTGFHRCVRINFWQALYLTGHIHSLDPTLKLIGKLVDMACMVCNKYN